MFCGLAASQGDIQGISDIDRVGRKPCGIGQQQDKQQAASHGRACLTGLTLTRA